MISTTSFNDRRNDDNDDNQNKIILCATQHIPPASLLKNQVVIHTKVFELS